MTETIKFGPEWLRNSVANVSSAPNSTSSPAPNMDSITSRPVLSDFRYGREEMLSLCDKSNRQPDILTRFIRLYVGDWQMPLALQPNLDDERSLGAAAPWGTTHIRPLMPGTGMGRGGTGIIRGGSIERGRGRGRGLYHGTGGYARSTSLYDERATEWSASGSAISPRKEYSRGGPGGMENWRKGTRDESGAGPEADWRSSNNGTAGARDKWARSTSWREGDATGDASGPNDQQQSSSPPTGGGVSQGPPSAHPKAPALYKKSWDEDHLPEWATESFDYGGTFDATGAFHDDERDPIVHDDGRPGKPRARQEPKKEVPLVEEDEPVKEPSPPLNHFDARSKDVGQDPSKFINFLDEREAQQNANFNPSAHNAKFNGAIPIASTHQHIDRMKEVADLVANLIMEDEPKDVMAPAQVQPPLAGHAQPINVDWFYRDPQGDTQGPFTAQDMSEWYKAGYFQESLMVRRSIDNAFMPLGQLVKVYGRSAPFMAAILMEPIQPPPPQVSVEIDPYRLQQQQQQQRMVAPPDVNGWNMMTPEQQIILLNMRMAHQRPPVPDPFVMKPAAAPANVASSMDLRRLMGSGGGGEFYQTPQPSNQALQPAPSQQEMDPIQHLLMQLQKTGGNGAAMNDPQPWMKQQQAAPPQMMVASNGGNHEMIQQQVMNQQQQIPNAMAQNHAPPQNNWNQAPMSIWEMPKGESSGPNHGPQQHHQQMAPPASQNHVKEMSLQPDLENAQNLVDDSSNMQFQTASSKSHDSKKKKQQQKETGEPDLKKAQGNKDGPQQKQNAAGGKKKGGNDKQQKKEERSNQPAAPAPWVGHQTPANGASLAKIQKTEAQRRQGEMVAQRERDQQKMEMMQKMEMQKNDGLKWGAPTVARVKTLDEIQAEEQKAAAIQQEREAVAFAKREALKKETSVVTNDVGIWNSTPHSMAWQQPKVWSGEQTSGSGFWEEPVKPSNSGKNAQMLSKSQTMATITTNKKQQQQQPAVKKQAPPARKPAIEKKEKKEDSDNEFTGWCHRTLGHMNSEVDGELREKIK